MQETQLVPGAPAPVKTPLTLPKPRGMRVAIVKGAACAWCGGSVIDCPYSGRWRSAWLRGFADKAQLNFHFGRRAA